MSIGDVFEDGGGNARGSGWGARKEAEDGAVTDNTAGLSRGERCKSRSTVSCSSLPEAILLQVEREVLAA